MTTDITELAQRARINAECGEHLSPAETMELVEALQSEKRICATWRETAEANSEKLEKAQQRIEELLEWNAGLAQESCERQQRISELLEGKVGNALLERENHHVELVGKLAERIADLESRTVKLPEPEQWDITQVLLCKKKVVAAIRAAGIKVEAE